MAEQAINTIYVLGEQPDVVCDAVIKSLAARVFEAPRPASTSEEEAPQEENMDVDDNATVTSAPSKSADERGDMGDAFTLAQLVFVVGHVAIKHLVYMELIEREMKRRKDVAAKGESNRTGDSFH